MLMLVFYHDLSGESRAKSEKWTKLGPWMDIPQPLGKFCLVVLMLRVLETERRSDGGITHK